MVFDSIQILFSSFSTENGTFH